MGITALECPACNGSKVHVFYSTGTPQYVPCSRCKGRGTVPDFEAKVRAVEQLLNDHGCDCDCDCNANGQDPHVCEEGPCFPCRVMVCLQDA